MKPFAIRATVEAPEAITFPTVLRELTPTSGSVQRPSVFVVTDPKQPYIMQWSFSFQRDLFAGTAVTATYAGSRGVKLSRTADVNAPLGTVLADGRRFYDPNTPEGTERHNLGYTGLQTRLWDANSWYNGLKLGLRKRFSSGFQYQFSYHWQKFMDEGSNMSGSRGDFGTSNFVTTDWQDHTLDRGLSAYHTAHTFSANWSVALPFGPGQRYGSGLSGVAARLAEGWQINGIVQLASGPAINISGDGDRTCDDFCSSRPDLISGKDNSPNTGDPNGWFGDVTDNFEEQPIGFYGNLGRNTGEGPGLATFDLSINKMFTLSETADLQFRAEFFNILNRANFASPNRTRTAFSRGNPVSTFG